MTSLYAVFDKCSIHEHGNNRNSIELYFPMNWNLSVEDVGEVVCYGGPRPNKDWLLLN